jgi:hypothetical protein
MNKVFSERCQEAEPMDRRNPTAGRAWAPAWAVTGALALLAPTAVAAAPKGMQIAQFTMTVTGTQTTDWTVDHVRYDGCVDGDVRTTGAGRERLTFASRRPQRVQAIRIGKDTALSAGTGGLPARGTIERRGSVSVTQLSGGESGCGGAPEGTAPPAADCGVRSWTGKLHPTLYGPGDAPVENPVLQLVDVLAFSGPDLPEGRHPGEAFANCPGSDAVLHATDTAELRPRDLFSRKRRIVVRGKERFERGADGHRETVTVEWRAVLKRRGKVRTVSERRVPGGPGTPPRRGTAR